MRRTNSSELGPDMQDHDHSHAERQNMHEGRGALKDNGICDFNVPRIAIGYEARRPGDCRRRAYQRAQRHRRFLAYRVELTESHDV